MKERSCPYCEFGGPCLKCDGHGSVFEVQCGTGVRFFPNTKNGYQEALKCEAIWGEGYARAGTATNT